jgi:diguanylate cyclase (GGDEF)-like protein
VLGRYGGDEFVWLLPEADLEMMVFAACKLIAELRAHRFELPRKEASVETIPVTTSLGGATLLPEEDVESLLRRADEALYKAKAAGRDRLAT